MNSRTGDLLLAAELQQIATEVDQPLSEVVAEAERDLLELGGSRGKVGTWLFAALSRFIRRRGYPRPPVYDLGELEQVRDAVRDGSVVFLVSHKTYLDFFVLFEFFYYLGLPPPRIFGGANMAFAGFGALARRAGGIFIRRSFRDDSVYKAALRFRLRDLILQGESFMWAIEGTRSRTGKLLIPRLGLLHYLTGSSPQLAEEKVRFIPVAVVYDQIPDVADMAAQEAGAAKTAESLMWFTRYLRSLGGSFGDIHLRFGKPISLHDTPAAPDLSQSTDSSTHQLEIQKLAFEACFRINGISPATPISLVLLSVLCHGRRNFKQIDQNVLELAAYVAAQHPAALEQKPSRKIDSDTGTRIKALLSAAVLESPEGWPNDEVRIRPQAISMAIYYSNMAVHHFVESAFTELALAMLVLQEGDFSQQHFEDESLALRELFKYEFFFSRKVEFQHHLLRELQALGLESAGPYQRPYQREAVLECLKGKQIRVAVGVLSPYLAAYRRVVAQFASQPASSDWSDEALLTQLLSAEESLSADKPLAARVSGLPETGVSRALLANGLLVAGNYGLRSLRNDANTQEKRRAFMGQLDRIGLALELLAEMNQVPRNSGVNA